MACTRPRAGCRREPQVNLNKSRPLAAALESRSGCGSDSVQGHEGNMSPSPGSALEEAATARTKQQECCDAGASRQRTACEFNMPASERKKSEAARNQLVAVSAAGPQIGPRHNTRLSQGRGPCDRPSAGTTAHVVSPQRRRRPATQAVGPAHRWRNRRPANSGGARAPNRRPHAARDRAAAQVYRIRPARAGSDPCVRAAAGMHGCQRAADVRTRNGAARRARPACARAPLGAAHSYQGAPSPAVASGRPPSRRSIHSLRSHAASAHANRPHQCKRPPRTGKSALARRPARRRHERTYHVDRGWRGAAMLRRS